MRAKERVLVWDHLHIRGEYILPWLHIEARLGSPPHTWRILSKGYCRFMANGITSTYVENTLNKSRYINDP